MGRYAKENVPADARRALQEHIRVGIDMLGVTQGSLSRDYSKVVGKSRSEQAAARSRAAKEYRWFRNHLYDGDPHFTYDVARALLKAIVHHPDFTAIPRSKRNEWVRTAHAMPALDPDKASDSGPPLAFVPPRKAERFANVLSSTLPLSSRKQKECAEAIMRYLRRNGDEMAVRVMAEYGMKISEWYGTSDGSPALPMDVLMEAYSVAFDLELRKS